MVRPFEKVNEDLQKIKDYLSLQQKHVVSESAIAEIYRVSLLLNGIDINKIPPSISCDILGDKMFQLGTKIKYSVASTDEPQFGYVAGYYVWGTDIKNHNRVFVEFVDVKTKTINSRLLDDVSVAE